GRPLAHGTHARSSGRSMPPAPSRNRRTRVRAAHRCDTATRGEHDARGTPSTAGSPMSREITAAVDREQGTFVLETAELEDPRDDEVLVRIVAAGLCHTDLVVRDQVYPVPLPIVLGHEGAGVVEAVGSAVTKVAPGDHVAVSFVPCARCRPCFD